MIKTLLTFSLLLIVTGCSRANGSPAAPPRAVAGNGVLLGSVQFVGTAPQMKPIEATDACCKNDPTLVDETVVVNPNQTLRNVIVYLENAPQTDGSAQPPALLDQVHCRYTPHVLAVQTGQTINVRSSDPTLHNVHFNPDKNEAKNLAFAAAGMTVPTTFEYAEIIKFRCDVHPWMHAYVGVFDNPFFAVTQDDGSFNIKGIPNGTYKLVAWHELYGRQEQTVTISDDKPLNVQFTFGSQN